MRENEQGIYAVKHFRVRVNDFTVNFHTLIFPDKLIVASDRPFCEKTVKKLTYGVKVNGNAAIAEEKSGLTEFGKKVLSGVRGIHENQINLYVLLIVLAIAALCFAFPDNEVCKQIRQDFQDIILPLAVFGITFMLVINSLSKEGS